VEKLLQLSRTESKSSLDFEPIDLVTIVELVIAGYRQRQDLTNRISLELASEGRPIVHADMDALGIALANLIDNALIHGKRGGPIFVRVGPEPSVSVISEGDLVSDDVMKSLPGRFVRGASLAEGAGLGLSIVQSIMIQMGGVLMLFSPPRQHAGAFEASLLWHERSVLGEMTESAI
jgi:two-component system OmpR family sensor kinase